MKHELSAREARVVGCLLEKQLTTPEQYPMTLKTLDLLLRKHIIRTLSGSRTMKYEHRFCNSEFGNLKFSPQEVAVVTTLLLRGAQTPGELRTRTNRLHDFSDVAEVEQTLTELTNREDGPFCVRLAREPGKRESRFMHLFSGEVSNVAGAAEEPLFSSAPESADLAARVETLEAEVAELKQRLENLLQHLAD